MSRRCCLISKPQIPKESKNRDFKFLLRAFKSSWLSDDENLVDLMMSYRGDP
jgi:hypothetical protein